MPLEFDVLWDCFRPFWIPLSWNKNVRSTHDSQWNVVIMILLADGPTQASGRTLAGKHYDDVIMGTIASQITSLTSVYSTVYSGEDQSKHQSSASLAFVWGIHRGPVNSPHKWPVTRKMSPFDDVIMRWRRRQTLKYEIYVRDLSQPYILRNIVNHNVFVS